MTAKVSQQPLNSILDSDIPPLPESLDKNTHSAADGSSSKNADGMTPSIIMAAQQLQCPAGSRNPPRGIQNLGSTSGDASPKSITRDLPNAYRLNLELPFPI
jgi:hypothetical protein